MEPTLHDGDWLLVDPDAYRDRLPAAGELVVAHDPRAAERLVVKRVATARADGLMLAGDHPAHALESEWLGPVTREAIVGRPWLRYWPVNRAGLIR
jgi:nickel-type superoxide dismutase maturation protease